MSKRKQQHIGRLGPIREPYDRVLIVCEGEKTEPHYFEALIELYKLSVVNVEVTSSPHSAPRHIVAHAQKIFDETKYDRVYCVFDRDEHTTYQEALNTIQTIIPVHTFYAITSNPCFEFWLLLHLWEDKDISTSPIVRSGKKSPCKCACHQIEQYIPEYEKEKGGEDTIALIFGDNGHNIGKAIKRAKTIEKSGELENRDNPRTQVHMLVEYLQNLKNPQKPMQIRACQLLEEMVTASKPYIVTTNYDHLQAIFRKHPKLQEQIGEVCKKIEQCANQFTLLPHEVKAAVRQKIEELKGQVTASK